MSQDSHSVASRSRRSPALILILAVFALGGCSTAYSIMPSHQQHHLPDGRET
jgi:hypothetical protein